MSESSLLELDARIVAEILRFVAISPIEIDESPLDQLLGSSTQSWESKCTRIRAALQPEDPVALEDAGLIVGVQPRQGCYLAGVSRDVAAFCFGMVEATRAQQGKMRGTELMGTATTWFQQLCREIDTIETERDTLAMGTPMAQVQASGRFRGAAVQLSAGATLRQVMSIWVRLGALALLLERLEAQLSLVGECDWGAQSDLYLIGRESMLF
mmetsp:Transcript_82529/g.220584  ORF Transcript_82529/g.220584 Transcript_82529/m.220584 type:complete len:212 (+) Transcript_82529:17-652(+)